MKVLPKIGELLRAGWFVGWIGFAGTGFAWWHAHRVSVSGEAARSQISKNEPVHVSLFLGNTGMQATSISDLVLLGEGDSVISSFRDTHRVQPVLPIPLGGPGEIRADIDVTDSEAHQVRAVQIKLLGGTVNHMPLVLYTSLAANIQGKAETKAALSQTAPSQEGEPLQKAQSPAQPPSSGCPTVRAPGGRPRLRTARRLWGLRLSSLPEDALGSRDLAAVVGGGKAELHAGARAFVPARSVRACGRNRPQDDSGLHRRWAAAARGR